MGRLERFRSPLLRPATIGVTTTGTAGAAPALEGRYAIEGRWPSWPLSVLPDSDGSGGLWPDV